MVKEFQVEKLVSHFGPIKSLNVVKKQYADNTNCFAFVDFVHGDDAIRAITELTGHVFQGQQIDVDWNRPRGPRAFELKPKDPTLED